MMDSIDQSDVDSDRTGTRREIIGTSNRVLEVNLTDRSLKIVTISDSDRKLFLGGKGLGLKLFRERVPPGADPLGPENLLVFMMGVMMGTGAPCSGRFAAVTKSPLTGIMLSCSCGGPFGMALKTAGYDGLIIGGSSAVPVYLTIDADDATFEDAASLWGLNTRETQARIAAGKKAGALAIGPAGENRVLFANVAAGHRFLGRGGMGAVMGAKNLKAVVALGGTHRITPRHPAAFEALKRKAIRQIDANHFTGHVYRRFGTSANVNLCNRGGILPVHNFRDGTHAKAQDVSGEAMQRKYNTRSSTCVPCKILCGHKGTYSDGSVHQIPEYETVSLLGTNIGVFDSDQITAWNELCGRLGLDTISTGSVIAWAMEAGEKNLFETDLKFGSPQGVSETIQAIAARQGRGNELAEGTRRLAAKYGGADFAIQVKGLEMAGYDPRGAWGQGLAYAVANRGACHLSATTFALEVFMGYLNPFTTRAKAPFVAFFENLYAAVNSLHLCQFTAFAHVLEEPIVKYTPKWLLGLNMQYLPRIARKLIFIPTLTGLYNSVTGLNLSQGEFLRAGERIHTLERYMNTLEGISRKDDTLPARFLREGRSGDPDGRRVPLEPMLDEYYHERGYDSRGVPAPRTLERLGLSERDLS
jgi:aldehyde:ferredoxin oxidoreductase